MSSFRNNQRLTLLLLRVGKQCLFKLKSRSCYVSIEKTNLCVETSILVCSWKAHRKFLTEKKFSSAWQEVSTGGLQRIRKFHLVRQEDSELNLSHVWQNLIYQQLKLAVNCQIFSKFSKFRNIKSFGHRPIKNNDSRNREQSPWKPRT